jgi:hypothetical protein
VDDSAGQTKITYDMIKDNLNKRVYCCFVITVIAMFFLCGCTSTFHSTKWKWMPEVQGVNALHKQKQLLKDKKDREIEAGTLKINILEAKF